VQRKREGPGNSTSGKKKKKRLSKGSETQDHRKSKIKGRFKKKQKGGKKYRKPRGEKRVDTSRSQYNQVEKGRLNGWKKRGTGTTQEVGI